ncbi:PLC-like phosphodiesterase [Lojkania enalia]|uniref:PLC-like phosphodiesterase n=1 Tax=Lojkania enalia TaxID=147567 RepID=A0A9P4N474_9PLEO|nr:PLC-like phosphodiesterase [Didymosphaeria enalia]
MLNPPTSTDLTPTRLHPTKERPCNGYIEYCNRRFSNVSMVVAHNSPFVVPGNIASNQKLHVLTQLADGIRGLQFQTHMPNGTLRLCHTSCDLLDAGTLESYLQAVSSWLATHPYEVIAIMMGNDDRVSPKSYIQPFERAEMLPYLYVPGNSTLTLDQWPTLSEMIIQNKRVVVMLDYLANQTEVPWLLNEFSYQWQTPFSPTNPTFPCIQQRPPNEAEEVSRNKMFMLNHNLNVEFSLNGLTGPILIPVYTELTRVNAISGNSSLGLNVQDCTKIWGRPPNWLLVDYYNFGNFNGSVFQVAATANNVSYGKSSCCGMEVVSAAKALKPTSTERLFVTAISILLCLM